MLGGVMTQKIKDKKIFNYRWCFQEIAFEIWVAKTSFYNISYEDICSNLLFHSSTICSKLNNKLLNLYIHTLTSVFDSNTIYKRLQKYRIAKDWWFLVSYCTSSDIYILYIFIPIIQQIFLLIRQHPVDDLIYKKDHSPYMPIYTFMWHWWNCLPLLSPSMSHDIIESC